MKDERDELNSEKSAEPSRPLEPDEGEATPPATTDGVPEGPGKKP